ncbi:36376_t:CDS:2, partial [Gigaspora margarita]
SLNLLLDSPPTMSSFYLLKKSVLNPVLTLDFCDCRYTEIMLGCIVLGEKNAFPVDLDIGKTIGHLKGAIKEKKSVALGITDANALKLWKVNIPESKKHEIYEGIDIKVKFGGEELDSDLRTIGGYFEGQPTAEHIHIIVEPPPPATTARNLPETLKYRDPQPLLKSSGSSWDFQASDTLRQKLKNAIRDHFKFWKAGQLNKMKIPQYFILAGAGEGKSRTAQELPNLLIEYTNDDVILQNRLKSALVFSLSFENETQLLRMVETDGSRAIGNRMLFQLLQQPGETWVEFKNRYDVSPEDVLRIIAKRQNQEFNDLNVIIIMDGLQVALDNLDDGKNKKSFFYDCISTLGILSISGPFIVSCCTATISMPIHDFLASSAQLSIFLPITSLKPPEINNSPVFGDDPVIKMFVNDMGGHGRALEALGEALDGKDLSEVNFIDLIDDVRSTLINNYLGWLSKIDYTKPMLRIILSHTLVNIDDTISGSNGKEIKIDHLIQLGLIRFESSDSNQIVGHLSCPYIWLWIMAHGNANDPLLRNWDLAYYKKVFNKSGESSIPPGCQYWQHFEYFVAQFRTLKSYVYDDGQQVDLCTIHDGAKHNFVQNSMIYNRNLTLTHSVRKVSTKSEDYNQDTKILCQTKEVDIAEAKHIVINAPCAKYSDSFCPIKMVNTGQLRIETHKCKLLKDSISQQKFDDEYKKATSEGDIFILYTSTSCKELELQNPMSAIISKENWKEYFGPFAGRCYNSAMGPPDINKATYTQLTGIEKIGKERAITIMKERKRFEFSDKEDFSTRTKIPRQELDPFFQVNK